MFRICACDWICVHSCFLLYFTFQINWTYHSFDKMFCVRILLFFFSVLCLVINFVLFTQAQAISFLQSAQICFLDMYNAPIIIIGNNTKNSISTACQFILCIGNLHSIQWLIRRFQLCCAVLSQTNTQTKPIGIYVEWDSVFNELISFEWWNSIESHFEWMNREKQSHTLFTHHRCLRVGISLRFAVYLWKFLREILQCVVDC